MSNESILAIARWYDPLFESVLGGLRAMTARVVPPKKGMKVLDVGCGTGAQLAIYQQGGCEVCGIDLSPPMLKVAKSKLGEKAALTNSDAIRIPYPNDTFDLVLSSLFLHQINAPLRSAVLEETIRLLKPDGQILLVDFHPEAARPIKGRLTYYFISTIEFFAGWEHFRNSRDFLSRGGIPKLAMDQRLKIHKTFVVGNGNLGVYLMRLA